MTVTLGNTVIYACVVSILIEAETKIEKKVNKFLYIVGIFKENFLNFLNPFKNCLFIVRNETARLRSRQLMYEAENK